MTTWHQDPDREVLSQGHGAARSTSVRAWVTAAVCLVIGALGGAQVDDALDKRRVAAELATAPPVLSAGVVQEAPDPVGDRRFAVPVHNGGEGVVTVEAATADGWLAEDERLRAVRIQPGAWALVPLRVRIDCEAIGASAPERLTVRSSTASGTFEQRLQMPASSRVLTDEGWRLCLDPSGSIPTDTDLLGAWFVEQAGRERGTVFRLREDGTFAIDPDLFRFGPTLDMLGTFTLSGRTLRLTAHGGYDCRSGERTRWDLTLLEDRRLHVRHRPDGERWCGIEDGEVWIARRIPEQTTPGTTQ